MRVTIPAPPAPRSHGHVAKVGYPLAVGAVGISSVGLLVVGGNPIVALVPVGLVAFGALLLKMPLRSTATGLVLAIFAFDETQESSGHWHTPLSTLADLVIYRMDSTLPIPAGFLSGMEVIAILLLGIRAYRRASGAVIDESGRVETPRVVGELVAICLAGVLLAEAIGMARGWGAAVWKVKNLVHPLLLTGAFIVAYRSPRDAVAVGRVVVFAACLKGVVAHIVQRIARAETGGMFNSAVSHGDSVVFAIGAFLVIVRLLEDPKRNRLLPSLAFLALIVLGCVENDRRLVWVMLAMSLLVAYLIRPLAGWQRTLTKATLVSIPLVLIYVAVGWNSTNGVFKPVRTLRSVADTSDDTSTYWREVEIWNIATSMRQDSLLGMGLGGEYKEYMYNDDISALYKEYREWPHNTVLGLLMLMGLVGFTAVWVLFPAVLFLAIRSYWFARSSDDRIVALGCIAAIISCLVMAWGDTGAHYLQFKTAFALAFAFSAKLAVTTGAWPVAPSPRTGSL